MRRTIAVVLVILSAPTCTRSSVPSPASDAQASPRATGVPSIATQPCPAPYGEPGATVERSVRVGGVVRTYWLHLPAGYDCTRGALVVGLHGYRGNGREFERDATPLSASIDDLGWIGLFPNGLAMSDEGWRSRVTSFNDIDSHRSFGPDGRTCTRDAYDYGDYQDAPRSADAQPCHWGTSYADDEGFIRAIVAKTQADFAVDPSRVFLIGFSQGAQTVQSLGWRMADVFTAISPHHGFSANGYARAPTTPMSLFQVWGTADHVVDGGGRPSADGYIYDSAAETVETWARAQGCRPQAVPYVTPQDGRRGWRAVEYPDCSTWARVVSASWNGRHHWPALETLAMLAFLQDMTG